MLLPTVVGGEELVLKHRPRDKMKQCTKCKKWKDHSEFSIERTGKDGLRSWCKKCRCEYMHKYYRRNRRSVTKYRSYEESHRLVDGVKEKRCSSCKKWRPESEFYKQRHTKDGLTVRCKKCADKATNLCRKRRLAHSASSGQAVEELRVKGNR